MSLTIVFSLDVWSLYILTSAKKMCVRIMNNLILCAVSTPKYSSLNPSSAYPRRLPFVLGAVGQLVNSKLL